MPAPAACQHDTVTHTRQVSLSLAGSQSGSHCIMRWHRTEADSCCLCDDVGFLQAHAAEKAAAAHEREMEVARLRALQEKVQDTRSAEDELRAKRYQVRPQRRHSNPDLKPPYVVYSHQPHTRLKTQQQHMHCASTHTLHARPAGCMTVPHRSHCPCCRRRPRTVSTATESRRQQPARQP